MRKLFAAAAPLLAALLTLGTSVSTPVYAQTPPHVFVGAATLDGVPVPDGTVIQGVIDGRPLSGAETAVLNGNFTLFVTQPPGGNTTLNLAVGGFVAEQAYSWRIGGATLAQLAASTRLPALRMSFDPPPPAVIQRGDRFQLSVNADSGVYQATGGHLELDYDPEVFRVDLDRSEANPERTREESLDTGSYQVRWDYSSPSSTSTWSGQLETFQLVVLDTAPAGDTSVTVQASLTGTTGEPFPLDPELLTYRVNVRGQSGDFNQDQVVDSIDLAALGAVWGKQTGQPGFEARFDTDHDGRIGVGDLVALVHGYRIRG